MSLLTPTIIEEAITNIMENKCKTTPSLNNDF